MARLEEHTLSADEAPQIQQQIFTLYDQLRSLPDENSYWCVGCKIDKPWGDQRLLTIAQLILPASNDQQGETLEIRESTTVMQAPYCPDCYSNSGLPELFAEMWPHQESAGESDDGIG